MKVAFLYDGWEASYFPSIQKFFTGHQLGGIPVPKDITLYQIYFALAKKGVEVCFFSSPHVLQLLLSKSTKYKASNEDSYKNYWGANWKVGNITFQCMPSLQSIFSRSYGEFLIEHYIKKLLEPDFLLSPPPLSWELIDASKHAGLANIIKEKFQRATLIAIDIETRPVRVTETFGESPMAHGMVAKKLTKRKTDPIEYIMQEITVVGFCGLWKEPDGRLISKSIVIPYKEFENYNLIKELCGNSVPKVMQNGKYDAIHLITNNIPIENFRYDTYGMMHSWYSELPRTLDFISSFTLREHMYWKDESSFNLEEYNAKDTHATLWACVSLLQRMPKWAKDNYAENFLQIFPCITCSLEGFAVDWEEFEKKKTYYENKIEETIKDAELVFGEGFNPNSPIQVKKLLTYFGLPAADSSDKKTMQKFKDLNPFTDRLISYVIDYRKASKVHSTYFQFPFLGDRWLFDLDPFGTETGRYASKSSSLWVGQQGQNFPMEARSPYIADKGWTLGGADNEQSESRCTAYISEDKNLIDTVENSPDFHKTNASLFFGLPFEEITKEIRTLSKRVNHGANYNMGESVLIESMGSKAVLRAGRLLKLPSNWNLKQIAHYLLESFNKAYPDIKGKYYNEVIEEVETTNMLVGATGWTRYCFQKPRESKPALNAYVAHPPQSLSVKIINRAFFKIWYNYQFKENIIRMKMQKHDEIIWQSLPENEWVGEKISEIMAEPTEVKGRLMVIPNEPEVGLRSWGQIGA